MEALLDKHEHLQTLIEAEWANYRQAIRENKEFEEIKAIYLNIKELQAKITNVTNEISVRLKLGN